MILLPSGILQLPCIRCNIVLIDLCGDFGRVAGLICYLRAACDCLVSCMIHTQRSSHCQESKVHREYLRESVLPHASRDHACSQSTPPLLPMPAPIHPFIPLFHLFSLLLSHSPTLLLSYSPPLPLSLLPMSLSHARTPLILRALLSTNRNIKARSSSVQICCKPTPKRKLDLRSSIHTYIL